MSKAWLALGALLLCVESHPTLALQAFERACRLGTPRGCAAAGTMYFFGQGIAEDKQRALGLLKEACDGRDGPACTLLEQARRQDRRPRPVPPRQP